MSRSLAISHDTSCTNKSNISPVDILIDAKSAHAHCVFFQVYRNADIIVFISLLLVLTVLVRPDDNSSESDVSGNPQFLPGQSHLSVSTSSICSPIRNLASFLWAHSLVEVYFGLTFIHSTGQDFTRGSLNLLRSSESINSFSSRGSTFSFQILTRSLPLYLPSKL